MADTDMVVATIYKTSTGEVLRAVKCPAYMMKLQFDPGAGEAKLDNVEGDSTLHVVQNGALVLKS